MRAPRGLALVAFTLLAGACIGEIKTMEPGPGPGPGPAPGPIDANVRQQYEGGVYQILAAKCLGCHNEAGGSSPAFIPASAAGSYDSFLGAPDVYGDLTAAGSPLYSEVVPGPHNGVTYTPTEQATILAFLEAQRAAGIANPTDGTPGAVSKQLLDSWSGCMALTDFEEVQFGERWANKGSDEGNCEQCHTTGAHGFRANDRNATMYEKLSTRAVDMLAYFRVDVLSASIQINRDHFRVVAEGEGIHVNHPEYEYGDDDDAMQALIELYDRTNARKLAGGCGPSRLP